MASPRRPPQMRVVKGVRRHGSPRRLKNIDGERHAIFTRRSSSHRHCRQRQLLPTSAVHAYTEPIKIPLPEHRTDFADCCWGCSSLQIVNWIAACPSHAHDSDRNDGNRPAENILQISPKATRQQLLRMPTGANNKHTNCLILWFQSKAATSYIQRKTNHWSNMLHSTIWRINWNSGSCLLY